MTDDRYIVKGVNAKGEPVEEAFSGALIREIAASRITREDVETIRAAARSEADGLEAIAKKLEAMLPVEVTGIELQHADDPIL